MSEYPLISEVVDACCHILKKPISLAKTGSLRFAPVRLYIRVVSASIFLLKAISLGGPNIELQASLGILDECIKALQTMAVDEVHLSSRYGTLIARHVSRFRRNFITSRTPAHGTVNTASQRIFKDIPSSASPANRRIYPGQEGMSANHQNRNQMQSQATYPEHELVSDLSSQFRQDQASERHLQDRGTQQGVEDSFSREDMTATTPSLPSLETTEAFYGSNTGLTQDWVVQPFDPGFAPFGIGDAQQMSGFDMGSLDFLWNLPPE